MPLRSRTFLAVILCIAPAIAPAARFIQAPAVPQPTRPGDLAGFLLENTDSHQINGTFVTFGTMFADHALPRGAGIGATVAGQDEPAQADVSTRYPDGSARFAIITLATPPLAASANADVMLRRTGMPATGAPPSLADALQRNRIAIDIDMAETDGTTSHHQIDLLRWFAATRDAGQLSPWRTGPLAHEVRITQRVASSLRLVIDLTAYRNGSLGADIQFDNDIAMSKQGGALTYGVTIRMNGRTIYHLPKIKQYQYQDWHLVLRSDGRSPIHVVHDIARLERLGAVPAYNLKVGIPAGSLFDEAKAMRAPGWDAPLANNSVTQYMPMTGGRPDIGPTTAANAIWLISQNPVAAAFALGQADAAAAVPWHFFYEKTGTYLTTDDIPDIWIDRRGGPQSGTTGLTQPVTDKTPWRPDVSHQPDLSYIPYLLTGRRFYLDQLDAQADFSILDQWPDPQARNNGEGIVVGEGEQVRGAAWSLREVQEAAFIDPDGSNLRRYFGKIVTNNMNYLLAHLPDWQAQEGEAYGYLPGAYGTPGMMAPWQQDFFATTMAAFAWRGVAGADKVLAWQTHFLAGSLLNSGPDFNPRDGIAYNLQVYDPKTKQHFTSWAAIARATAASGQSNGQGWAHSQGYYGMTRMAALAAIHNATGSAEALRGFEWVAKSGAPFTDLESLAGSPQYWIVPQSDAARPDHGP